jgi:glutathione S-transferase
MTVMGDMLLELYYLKEADSICSNRAILALAEKGITDWTPRYIELLKEDQFKPEYLKLNPKGQVPTLVHDGRAIRESSIITNYIDDLKPEPALKPADPADRALMQEWIKDSDETGYQATASINFVTRFRLSIPLDVLESRWKRQPDIERTHRQQSCVKEGLESLYLYRAIGGWDRIFGKLEETLSDGRLWVMGDQFTLVEVNYTPFIKVLEMIDLLDLWLEGRPNLTRWWDNIASRPSYAELDDYEGQREDKETAHAKAGQAVAEDFRKILQEYRASRPA